MLKVRERDVLLSSKANLIRGLQHLKASHIQLPLKLRLSS